MLGPLGCLFSKSSFSEATHKSLFHNSRDLSEKLPFRSPHIVGILLSELGQQISSKLVQFSRPIIESVSEEEMTFAGRKLHQLEGLLPNRAPRLPNAGQEDVLRFRHGLGDALQPVAHVDLPRPGQVHAQVLWHPKRIF